MLTTTTISITPDELKELIINAVQEAKGKQDKPTIAEEILSRKEAARELKVTFPTLKALTLAGHIKAYRIGSNVTYNKGELNKALVPYLTDIQPKAKRA